MGERLGSVLNECLVVLFVLVFYGFCIFDAIHSPFTDRSH